MSGRRRDEFAIGAAEFLPGQLLAKNQHAQQLILLADRDGKHRAGQRERRRSDPGRETPACRRGGCFAALATSPFPRR
jgi:hypothetical protein